MDISSTPPCSFAGLHKAFQIQQTDSRSHWRQAKVYGTRVSNTGPLQTTVFEARKQEDWMKPDFTSCAEIQGPLRKARPKVTAERYEAVASRLNFLSS